MADVLRELGGLDILYVHGKTGGPADAVILSREAWDSLPKTWVPSMNHGHAEGGGDPFELVSAAPRECFGPED